MGKIVRHEINEDWAHAGMVEAGEFVFTGYCVGNLGQDVEAQINGAFDDLERRLAAVGLALSSVVKMDCLFRDVWNIPVMEKVIRERFPAGQYPARKSIQTEFAHRGGAEGGLLFQLDAVAYREKP